MARELQWILFLERPLGKLAGMMWKTKAWETVQDKGYRDELLPLGLDHAHGIRLLPHR